MKCKKCFQCNRPMDDNIQYSNQQCKTIISMNKLWIHTWIYFIILSKRAYDNNIFNILCLNTRIIWFINHLSIWQLMVTGTYGLIGSHVVWVVEWDTSVEEGHVTILFRLMVVTTVEGTPMRYKPAKNHIVQVMSND